MSFTYSESWLGISFVTLVIFFSLFFQTYEQLTMYNMRRYRWKCLINSQIVSFFQLIISTLSFNLLRNALQNTSDNMDSKMYQSLRIGTYYNVFLYLYTWTYVYRYEHRTIYIIPVEMYRSNALDIRARNDSPIFRANINLKGGWIFSSGEKSTTLRTARGALCKVQHCTATFTFNKSQWIDNIRLKCQLEQQVVTHNTT